MRYLSEFRSPELVESLLIEQNRFVDACCMKGGAEREDESEEDGP